MYKKYQNIDFFVYDISADEIPLDGFSDTLPLKVLYGGITALNKGIIIDITNKIIYKNVVSFMFYGEYMEYIHDEIDYIVEDAGKDVITFSVEGDSSQDILYDMLQLWDCCGDNFQCVLFLNFLDSKSMEICSAISLNVG
jgi:hypothetical protein